MTPGGYFGRALVVDVGSGEADRLDLPEPVLRGCIGGAGLGTWLMHRLAPAEVDPLGPDAPLAFVFSPWSALRSPRARSSPWWRSRRSQAC